jgi:O-antigen ligase
MTQSFSITVPPTGERFVAGTVLAAAVLLPPLAVESPLAVAPLLTAVALALLAADAKRIFAGFGQLLPLTGLLAALSAWATASALWSILPQHSLFEGLRFFAISAEGLIVLGAASVLSAEQAKRLGHGAALGVALALLLLAFERVSDASLSRLLYRIPHDIPVLFTRYDRGTTILVLALWPALAGLRRRAWWWSGGLTLAVAAATWIMLSQAAVVALVAGLAAFALAYHAPRFTAAALAAGLIVLAVFLPLATPSDNAVIALQHEAPWVKFSGIHRLLIWRFAADRIAERPLIGWGMDASRELPGGHTNLAAALPAAGYNVTMEAMPLHPHNAILQWRLELGLPGTLLGLAVVLWGLWRAGFKAQIERGPRAEALAWSASALVIAMLSFGIWQAWWLSSLWLTSALIAGASADER